jgi:hypothetical protein
METSLEPPKRRLSGSIGKSGKGLWGMAKAGVHMPVGRALLLSCVALLSACQSPKSEEKAPAADSTAGAYASDRAPPAQRAFMKRLVAQFVEMKRQYDSAPNGVVGHQLQEKWEANYCKSIRNGLFFTNWSGRLTALSQSDDKVYFSIDLGSGFEMKSSYAYTAMEINSPAYNDISKVKIGDVVTFSGQTWGNESCDMQQHDLTSPKFSNANIFIYADTFNGKSTRVPPPPPSPDPAPASEAAPADGPAPNADTNTDPAASTEPTGAAATRESH